MENDIYHKYLEFFDPSSGLKNLSHMWMARPGSKKSDKDCMLLFQQAELKKRMDSSILEPNEQMLAEHNKTCMQLVFSQDKLHQCLLNSKVAINQNISSNLSM